MHLSAAIVPPREALEELVRAVASVVPGQPDTGHRAERPRRLPVLGRERSQRPEWLGRSGASDASAKPPQLEVVPTTQLHVPLVTFGNLATPDASRLAGVLASEATGWERPTLRFAGAAALEFPGDTSVWTRIVGDVERLEVIGKGVSRVAQGLNLFVDRRRFRPWMSVGTITDSTEPAYLEALVARLERFSGIGWTVPEIVLLKGSTGESEIPQASAHIPLG